MDTTITTARRRTAPGRKARKNGEGSVYQLKTGRNKGKWVAAVSLPDGKRKFFYGKTSAEVVAKLKEAHGQEAEGQPVAEAGKMMTGAWLDYWVEEIVRTGRRSNTYVGYRRYVNLHLKPAIGSIPLTKLKVSDVHQLLNAQRQSGLKERTIFHTRAILRAALNHAITDSRTQLRVNVAEQVGAIKVPKFRRKLWTTEESLRFQGTIGGSRLMALYLVALTLGLRQSEVIGLTWEDVDLRAGKLSIRKGLHRVAGAFVLTDTKSQTSRRSLRLPAVVASALRQHWEQATARGPEDFLFTSIEGGPLHASTLRRDFYEATEQAGLPRIPFSSLRACCATILQERGVSLTTAQAMLGHSNIATTAGHYAQATTVSMDEAIDALDDLYVA